MRRIGHRRMTATMLVLVALAAVTGGPGGGAVRADEVGPHDACVATSAWPGPQSWGYAGLSGGTRCRIRASEGEAYLAAGSWQLVILRPGKHPGGEWLDRAGRPTNGEGRRSVARTRIVLTSENARPACATAIRRGDVVDASVGTSGMITIGSPWGGGDVENTVWGAATPGDHRDCLLPAEPT